MKTPVGDLSVTMENGAITRLTWAEGDVPDEVAGKLNDYFSRNLKVFDFKYTLHGTEFQKKVWEALMNIPYGTTKTYADIAREIGSHPRAVGGAVGANPIPILIPCHRVMGADGSLTGFSGGEGVKTKKILLQIEGVL